MTGREGDDGFGRREPLSGQECAPQSSAVVLGCSAERKGRDCERWAGGEWIKGAGGERGD